MWVQGWTSHKVYQVSVVVEVGSLTLSDLMDRSSSLGWTAIMTNVRAVTLKPRKTRNEPNGMNTLELCEVDNLSFSFQEDRRIPSLL